MIEYLYEEGVEPCEKEPLKVRLDGKIVGAIHKVEAGYRYIPKGVCEQCGGDIFDTVAKVQKSLTED
jgi:hypothetical protein